MHDAIAYRLMVKQRLRQCHALKILQVLIKKCENPPSLSSWLVANIESNDKRFPLRNLYVVHSEIDWFVFLHKSWKYMHVAASLLHSVYDPTCDPFLQIQYIVIRTGFSVGADYKVV